MMARTGAAEARRWAVRIDVGRRRVIDRGDDLALRAQQAIRKRAGRTILPASLWSPSQQAPAGVQASDAPLSQRVLPLPASANVVRALTGKRRPSLDAWSPLGERPSEAPAVLLLITGGGLPGAWTPADAALLARERSVRHPSTPLHTLLACPTEERGTLVGLLRGQEGRDPSGVQVGTLPDAGTAARERAAVDALRPVDAVLVPDLTTADPLFADLAAAAGRPILGPEDAETAPTDIILLGRAARMALAGMDTSSPRDGTTPFPTADARVTAERRRVVVAGHDLKFAGELVQELCDRGHEVRVDAWAGHERHDLEASRSLADWADVVHCEWSLGNLVWYSRHLPPDTRLTTRTHLQEAGTEFPRRTRADAVDAWVFVADHVRDQVLQDVPLDVRRAHTVPNRVNDPGEAVRRAALDRPGRRFVLGLVGALPQRKGLHRALDVLAALRAQDPRYVLRIRGRGPTETPWIANDAAALAYYRRQEDRLVKEPLLRGAVQWDPFGPDMDAWYAGVGTVLSVSDFESFHFTLPDGAMHGCLPRSLAWAGADRLYPLSWLAPDTQALAEAILRDVTDTDTWALSVRTAAKHVAESFGPEHSTRPLADLVLGRR